MSTVDIERFVSDLQANASLLDEAKGVSGGVAAMADFAKSKGYDVTADEAKAYISDKANAELSDDQMDAVAGGKGGVSGPQSNTEAVVAVIDVITIYGSANTTTNASLVLAVMGSAATSVVAT